MPYPQRAIRTHDFLYIINFQPDRWPLGDPYRLDGDNPPTRRGADRGHLRARFADDGRRPDQGLAGRARATTRSGSRYFELAYGKRPREELYDLADDPHQVKNVAADPNTPRSGRSWSGG